MNRMLGLLALSLIALASSLAQAATDYAFSYTFEQGSSVTGSFSGVANGNLINDLSDIHFSLNGTPVAAATTGRQAPIPSSC